jgi:hypothetical protein
MYDMKFYILLIFLISSMFLVAGCCSNSDANCDEEEGVTIRIYHDSDMDVEDMIVRWEAGKASGEAAHRPKQERPKEGRFFIAENSSTLGTKITIDVVLEDQVISQETYTITWKKTVCGEAEGASWCDDPTYEWAEIEIDLRKEED